MMFDRQINYEAEAIKLQHMSCWNMLKALWLTLSRPVFDRLFPPEMLKMVEKTLNETDPSDGKVLMKLVEKLAEPHAGEKILMHPRTWSDFIVDQRRLEIADEMVDVTEKQVAEVKKALDAENAEQDLKLIASNMINPQRMGISEEDYVMFGPGMGQGRAGTEKEERWTTIMHADGTVRVSLLDYDEQAMKLGVMLATKVCAPEDVEETKEEIRGMVRKAKHLEGADEYDV